MTFSSSSLEVQGEVMFSKRFRNKIQISVKN